MCLFRTCSLVVFARAFQFFGAANTRQLRVECGAAREQRHKRTGVWSFSTSMHGNGPKTTVIET